jgi:GMP synthase-like glutamine amidotransferase
VSARPRLRILAIGDDRNAPGFLGERATELGFEVICVSRLDGDPADLRLDGHDMLLPLGSVWSVNDAPTTPWIDSELALLRSAIREKVPILGICFGAQELAVALGGIVTRAERLELGWVSVETADADRVPHGPWFAWHHDEIHPPASASVLATNTSGVQAFMDGVNLGVQFHPEVTLPVIDFWCEHGESDLTRAGTSRPQLLAESPARLVQARKSAFRLLDAFLGRWLDTT